MTTVLHKQGKLLNFFLTARLFVAAPDIVQEDSPTVVVAQPDEEELSMKRKLDSKSNLLDLFF